MRQDLYKRKGSFWGRTQYERFREWVCPPYTTPPMFFYSPFVQASRITTGIGNVSIKNGTYDATTGVFSGTLCTTFSSVNLAAEYPFVPNIYDGVVDVIVGIRSSTGSARSVLLKNVATVTVAGQIANTSSIVQDFSISSATDTTYDTISLIYLIKLENDDGGTLLIERSSYSQKEKISTFFASSGANSTVGNYIVKPSDLLLRSVGTFSTSDYKVKYSSTRTESFDQVWNVGSYSSYAVLGIRMPTLSAGEFLALSISPTTATLSDMKKLSDRHRVNEVKKGAVFYTDENNKETQLDLALNANYGHRSNYVLIYDDSNKIPNGMYFTTAYDWYGVAINARDGGYIFSNCWLLRPGAERFITVGGLIPNITYKLRLHICKISTDPVFNVSGNSVWNSYPLTNSPDSGTIWKDGTQRTWTSTSVPKPAGFDNAAYRRSIIDNNVILLTGKDSVSEVSVTPTGVTQTLFNILSTYATVYNLEATISDSDLSTESTSIVVTWETYTFKTPPSLWKISVNIGYTSPYIHDIEISGTASDFSGTNEYGTIEYTRTLSDSKYTHTLTIPAIQTDKDNLVTITVKGKLNNGQEY